MLEKSTDEEKKKDDIEELRAVINTLNADKAVMVDELTTLKAKLRTYEMKDGKEQIDKMKGDISGLISQLSNITRSTTPTSITPEFMNTLRGGFNRVFTMWDGVLEFEEKIKNL